ncbi:pectate lyase [Phenylobacterium sp.]|jgi:hypothetical protein|uniref:pectate lyase family protein n=1 Tax=Phenylobacterium sp. TaxID=1871053 RepID=UPI002F9400A1
MRPILMLLPLMLLAGCATAPPAGPPDVVAFPGAEGAGRLSLGGRGGAVVKVTSLEDSGPGTLRAAVEAKGPRTVIFETGGTIRLKTPLRVRNGRITIAGQTAPGGGITLRDQPLVIAADDVVVRFVRSRLGDETGVQADAIDIVRGRRIILDHVSASWSVDETLSAGSRYDPPEAGVYDVTVQWSVIAESLNRSKHDKGEHGYGSLVRGGYGARMSFHHNLWASHTARMPRPGNYNGPDKDPTGPVIEFRSNVFYNWGRERAGYNADEAAHITYSFVDNAYVPGPDSKGKSAFEEKNRLSKAWFAGNLMDGVAPKDPWSLVIGAPPADYRLPGPPDVAPVTAEAAADAYRRVLFEAGASRPRDPVDARIVEGIRSRQGRIVDSQASVGGWPELARGRARQDSDEDGMPDEWEHRRGLDPVRPEGHEDIDGDGYTNLEIWLAELAEGKARP